MTVPTTASSANFPWDGTQIAFACMWPANAAADLVVTHVSAAGTITGLALGVNYNVALDPATRFPTLTPVFLPGIVGVIAVKRMTALPQAIVVAGDTIPAEVLQNALDVAAMRDQDVRRDLDQLSTLQSALAASPYGALPITRGQAMLALKGNVTAGVNWLTAVQAALPPNEADVNNIRFADAFWPAGGAAWAFVQAALAAALTGGFSPVQLAALQTQAIALRLTP